MRRMQRAHRNTIVGLRVQKLLAVDSADHTADLRSVWRAATSL
jgi:hypothetical protein